MVVRRGLVGIAAVLLVGACGGEPDVPSSPATVPSEDGAAGGTSSAAPRPTADPPEEFAAEGVVVGPSDVLVGYTAAFALERDIDSGKLTGVVARDLATGNELWHWQPDASVVGNGPSDQPSPALALSRDGDTERLQFSGVRTVEGSGTQQATHLLRTVVLDPATGDVLGEGEAELPTEIDVDGPIGDVTVTSVGLHDQYAVSTVRSGDTLPLTLIADVAAGTAAWAERGFLATGLGEANSTGLAIGLVAEDEFFDDGSLRAIALDTRRPLWTGEVVTDNTLAVPAPTLVTADVPGGDSYSTATALFDAATGRRLVAVPSRADCLFDERDVVVCASADELIGFDAVTAKRLWRLPDEAAGRVNPGLDAAFHGRVYADGVILDARTGEDVVPELPLTAHVVVPGYAISREHDQAIAYPATS